MIWLLLVLYQVICQHDLLNELCNRFWRIFPVVHEPKWCGRKCSHSLAVLVLEVFNQLSILIFVCYQHEKHCQAAISGVLFSLINLILLLYISQDSFFSIRHPPVKDIPPPTCQYGWLHFFDSILESVHVLLTWHVSILYYCLQSISCFKQCLC